MFIILFNQDRLWRKTRKPNINNPCIGTDCNRNYDFEWNTCSRNPSRTTYGGDIPFSEPETIAVRELMTALSPNLKFYMSLHSHAQSILYPWGYKRYVNVDLFYIWSIFEQYAKIRTLYTVYIITKLWTNVN